MLVSAKKKTAKIISGLIQKHVNVSAKRKIALQIISLIPTFVIVNANKKPVLSIIDSINKFVIAFVMILNHAQLINISIALLAAVNANINNVILIIGIIMIHAIVNA